MLGFMIFERQGVLSKLQCLALSLRSSESKSQTVMSKSYLSILIAKILNFPRLRDSNHLAPPFKKVRLRLVMLIEKILPAANGILLHLSF